MKKAVNPLIGIILLGLLSACSQTPLEKLKSDSVYQDLDEAFWIKQIEQRTPLWHQAAEYCMDHADKPNCDPVNKVFMCSGDCHKKAPPLGHSGESVHIEG